MAEFQTSDLDHLKNLIVNKLALPTPAANGQTILFFAVQRSDPGEAAELAKLILTHNPDPQVALYTDHSLRQSALFFAVRAGNLEAARLLISAGCSAATKDAIGQVPLFYAAREGHSHIVESEEFLSTADCIDIHGQTALFYAAAAGRTEVCQILLKRFPNLLYHRDFQGCRAVSFAKRAGHAEVASLLQGEPEDGARRRYRLVPVEGKISEERIASFEEKCPEIAVWSARLGPISQNLESVVEYVKKHSVVHAAPKKRLIKNDTWETPAKRMLTDLARRPEAGIFMIPVDPVKHQCPDYHLVITQPMDFGTISSRLKGGHYAGDLDQFKADIELVFFNCLQYNAEGTVPRALCKKTQDWISPRLAKLESAPSVLTPVSAISSSK